MPAVSLKYQDPMEHHHQDHSSSHESYSSSSTSSSKQTSPAPSNRSDSTRASPGLKGAKGKLFQCSGYGDCRMVFTRSEHLARHARKHTGEKPFQCVVDGCTRMFSRYDNMVQHTQTHTKGARRETSAGIAHKIEIDRRRKSEAGLLGTPAGPRSGSKANSTVKPKRSSVSSMAGSDAHAKSTLVRKNRVNSMPVISSVTPSSSRGEGVFSKGDSDSASYADLSTRNGDDKSKTRKPSLIRSASMRKGSLGSSSSSSSTLSWYASKLHHKSSLDQGTDGYGRHGNLDAHLPPLNNYVYDYTREQSRYHRTRHPLSPERSSSSDDEGEDSDEAGSSSTQHSRRGSYKQQAWGGMVDSLDSCKLPPLRDPSDSTASPYSARLPSIMSPSGYRSHSISHLHGYRQDRKPYAPKVRRLSLADLETPIHETKKAVDQSMNIQQAKFEGIDVSEDEIHALEAFGTLWSQGRDVDMDEQPLPQPQSQPSLSTETVVKCEFQQPTPPDTDGHEDLPTQHGKDSELLPPQEAMSGTHMDLD
ncbi:hypothetical protein KVV02_008404 [Mortierella alpina]|uniref:C2H2-type domain-containing protein n=1 Tax=Mortierella alpina TaxID=64518 RepID=A0A9P8CZV3_MORAP|nr:hypothetical protein KVV02_008404 [Mortierella alpina]